MNREYVAQSGKWTAFDVSDESPYDALIGARVDAIEPMPPGVPDIRLITVRVGTL